MEQTVKVWDPVVRLFHWTLVVSFAIVWLTAEEWDAVHEWAGYTAAGLIGLRVLWGLMGSRYARFTQFVRSPRASLNYLRAILRGREPRYLGHNPAGAMMIVTLILTMVVTALTGWLITMETYQGIKWIEEVHEFFGNLMLIMVGIHVAGVILTSLRHRENLVRSMINGRKRAAGKGDIA